MGRILYDLGHLVKKPCGFGVAADCHLQHQLVHEVERASCGKCQVEFLGKYDTQIFTPDEIETAIIKMCEGGNN